MKHGKQYVESAKLVDRTKAYDMNEVPVGCVIVYNDKIIARGYNKRETLESSLAHAEIIAIKKACKKLNSFLHL